MDHDDINDLIDEWLGDDGDGRPAPTWRATIRGGRLMLTHWAPWLVQGGPQTKLLTERGQAGITIADLTVHGEDGRRGQRPLLRRRHASSSEAEEVLIEWATRVGYRRIWLSDRLVTIEPEPDKIGTRIGPLSRPARPPGATPRRSSGSRVKHSGLFPKWCPVCGCELPQWERSRPSSPPAGKEARRRRGLVARQKVAARSRPKKT